MTNDIERKLLARIVIEHGKMGDLPIIRGQRITPATVLRMLANGATREQVLDTYPVLERADIDACLLYAASSIEALGPKNPRRLFDQVRSGKPMRRPGASMATGARLKAKLRAKRST